jgi:hypothetical protein
MHTVFVETTHPEQADPESKIDLRFPDLLSFANALNKK